MQQGLILLLRPIMQPFHETSPDVLPTNQCGYNITAGTSHDLALMRTGGESPREVGVKRAPVAVEV